MSLKKHKIFIDTASAGLVSIVEHNLCGTPLVTLTDYDSGQEVYTSLYDPRVAELKVLDKDNVQISFASSFKGYLYLHVLEIDAFTPEERIKLLEEKYLSLLQGMDTLTNKDQWIQMNNLLSQQTDTLENRVHALETTLQFLTDTVGNL